MSEPQEIEKTATAYASNAIESEKHGEVAKAISLYQKAIECLNQLIQRYPEHRFSKIYNEWVAAYEERISTLQKANAKPKKPPVESQEPTEKPPFKKESSVDLASILLEINRKLDDMAASIAQLKDDIVNLKVNVNDAAGKSELAAKEVAEIRNLVYAIKYDR
jgi:tetratricopeptide (TPR) repeat protein